MRVLNVSSHFIRNCVCGSAWWETEVGGFLILEAFRELEYFETIALWKC